MYTDNSTNNSYPKTLIIRNHEGGMIWQVYHVEKKIEAERLADNAFGNGFLAITIEDFKPDMEQTWGDWREVSRGIID